MGVEWHHSLYFEACKGCMRGGYGVSLDFSHAFDCVSSKLVGEVLSKLLPPPLQQWGQLLCFQWGSLQKWLNYGGHVSNSPVSGDMGISCFDDPSPCREDFRGANYGGMKLNFNAFIYG